jgi:predicted TIM-barrel fold metal-dependent hydrolase
MVEAGLPGLVHIADPDVWWTHRYHDPDQYEAKRFTYRQLTNTLGRFPNLRLLVAHMGGWPENLEFLDRLLQHYPNCYFDTSGTKWIARELSVQAEEARKFIVRYADRLLFGSDLVARSRLDLAHYCSRYWVHRHLYEKNHRVLSPIKDPDAPGAVNVAGLDLPEDVLKRLYVENARRFYGLERT